MGRVDDFEEISEGVFRLYCDDVGPQCVDHDGLRLYRFMDRFYILNEHLDEMTRAEVNSLCRARAQFPALITDVNRQVKEFFCAFVEKYRPRSILEIGAGRHPLFETAPDGVDYVLADADADVKSGLTKEAEFKEFSESSPALAYQNGYFHLIIAVFVMQFPFHEVQIAEVSRCLADDGVFVANVYRRRPVARDALMNALVRAGFVVRVLPDPKNLCRDHEYWAIAKNASEAEKCLLMLESVVS